MLHGETVVCLVEEVK